MNALLEILVFKKWIDNVRGKKKPKGKWAAENFCC